MIDDQTITYEVTVWGRDWRRTLELITDIDLVDGCLILTTQLDGCPLFQQGYPLAAIGGWDVKENKLAH